MKLLKFYVVEIFIKYKVPKSTYEGKNTNDPVAIEEKQKSFQNYFQ
jgi:hypothetical protein